jgi:hypothetical protein
MAMLKEREDHMAKLEGITRRTADRLQVERHSSECPTLKTYLMEAYGKYEDAVDEVNKTREQLGKEAVLKLTRPTEIDLTCEISSPTSTPKSDPKPKAGPASSSPKSTPEPQRKQPPAKAFPDVQLSSLLDRFQHAYERCDLEALQSLSRMSENRLKNAEFMFANYSAFTTTIRDITATEEGATAILMLETGTRDGGDIISIPERARAVKLRIIRAGHDWVIEW